MDERLASAAKLVEAAKRGDVAAVRASLDGGADVESKDYSVVRLWLSNAARRSTACCACAAACACASGGAALTHAARHAEQPNAAVLGRLAGQRGAGAAAAGARRVHGGQE
jgi:hypothetical protein